MSNKRHVLLVEPGFKSTREQVLKVMGGLNDIELHACWGMDYYSPQWIQPYVNGTFKFNYKAKDLVERIKEYEESKGIRFAGIMTYLDMSVHTVNDACHELGLPVISKYRGKTIRNKHLVRERLKATGADSSFWFAKISSVSDIDQIDWSAVQFPIIAKPPEMMASLAVVKINSIDELRAWFPLIANADFEGENLRDHYGDIDQSVLLEEFVQGPEYSAETLVVNGKAHLLGITKKFTSEGLYWDELGHCFPADDLTSEQEEQVFHMIRSSHEAVGFENSITHTEFRMTPNGPRIMEINPRLCGDYIYRILEKSKGVSTGRIAVLAALGECPSVVPSFRTKEQSFSVRFITDVEHGRVISPVTPRLTDDSLEVISYVDPGELLFKPKEAYGNRVGAIIGRSTLLQGDLDSLVDYKSERPLAFLESSEETMAVFQGRPGDIEAMVEVERSTWSPTQAATAETIARRAECSPEGTLLCFGLRTKKLLGFFSLVRASRSQIAAPYNWGQFSDLSKTLMNEESTKNLDCLCGVSLTVTDQAPRGCGTLLMKAAVSRGRDLGLKQLINGIRLPRFSKWRQSSNKSATEYVEELKSGLQNEPIYSIIVSTGGRPLALVHNYYDDPESENFGLICVHDL